MCSDFVEYSSGPGSSYKLIFLEKTSELSKETQQKARKCEFGTRTILEISEANELVHERGLEKQYMPLFYQNQWPLLFHFHQPQ